LALNKIISESTVLYIIAGMLVFTGIILIFGMKDVIKTKDFEIRRERSDSVENKKRFVFVLK